MGTGRLRVFVSSRMEELRHERAAIRTALAAMNIDTFLFDLDIGASPIDIQQTYLHEEEAADIYVGLFWKGFGRHTVREFEHAWSLGMDCLIYERPEDAAGGRDPDLQSFLDRIGNADTGRVTIGRFDSVDQLASRINDDISLWIRRLADERKERAAGIYHGVPSRLPSDFVGRGEQIARLVRALRSGKDVAVDGLPGIGKTTLALALVHQPGIRRHFRDGLLWASLGPGADAASAINSWAQALEHAGLATSDISRLPDLPDRTQVLRDAIGSRRMLLVIDDVWDSEAAKALHCGGPHCCHLITTRNREIAHALAGAASAETLADLDEKNAVELLQQLAPEACALEPARVLELLRAVGGLPQAVRLIGGYLARPQAGMFGDVFADLRASAFDQLADPKKRLELAEQRLGSPGNRKMTLGETIRLSVDDLPEPARACLHALGSFAARPQRFTPAAAVAVTDADSGVLALLGSRNLVDVDQASRTLSLHPTVADVARTAEAPGAAVKHLQYYLSAIKEDGRDPAKADEAYGQLRWAWQRASDDETLLVMLGVVEPYQARRGLFAETLAWATRALPVAEARNHTAAVARLLGMMGEAEKDLGLYERALTNYRRSLATWAAVDDPSIDVRTWQIDARGRIAVLLGSMGRLDEALAEMEETSAIAEASDNRVKAAEILIAKSALLNRAGRSASAVEVARQARERLHQLGAKDSEADCLMLLGAIHRDLGEPEVALEHLRESMALQAEGGRLAGDTESRLLMASISSARHQLEDALVFARKACADATAAGARNLQIGGLGVIAGLLVKLGRIDDALDHYNQQLAMHAETNNRAGQASVLDKLAGVYYKTKRYVEAVEAAEKALAIYRAHGDRVQEALSLEVIQYHYQSLDKPQQATRCAREALAIWKDLANLNAQIRVLASIGSKHVQNFEQDLALLAYEQADWLARGGTSAAPGYPAARRRPFVPPLVVGIGLRLSGWLDSDRLRETFHDAIDRAREAVRAATGILPPPVLLTDRRPDIELDAYTVFVDLVPFASATLNEDERLFPGPVDALVSAGVSARTAANPFDGRAAAWVSREHWSSLERSGRPLWTTIDYIAWHVRFAMTKHLRSFVGHQQTLEMVEREMPEQGAALLRDFRALSGLVQVLRNLVDERVPVLALRSIVETFRELHPHGTQRLDMLKAIRLLPDVRPRLPGNEQPTSYFCLPDATEDEIARSIAVADGVPYLQMDPAAVERTLALIRSWVHSQIDATTLVVRNAAIRRFARRLVELEFPGVMVLSQDELLPGIGAIVHQAADARVA
jgi:tetratricopeptide (TPR) repeat protein